MKLPRIMVYALFGMFAWFCIALFAVSLGVAPQQLSVAAVEQTIAQVVTERTAPAPVVLDLSPAVLDPRVKTSGCVAEGGVPDHACTPGAIFASTTLEQICVPGYTKKVRSVSVSLKKKIYKAYGVSYPQPTGSFEADHLIPLELGGSNDIANLFPEAAAPAPGFKEKDLVENYLHNEACAGRMSLPRAQEQIASDWLAVYRTLTPEQIDFLKKQYRTWAPN